MVEVIADVVRPTEFQTPVTTTMPNMSGALIVSGAKLWFHDGSKPTLVTSA